MAKVSIYIDGSNFYHGLRDNCQKTRKKFSFQKFVEKLVGKRQLARTYYYNSPVPKEQDPERAKKQQKFFDSIRHIPYFEIRYGRLAKRPSGVFVEKEVDVRIATDMLMGAFRNRYDVAVLVSGDGDFRHVIQAVKDLGKHVEIVYFKNSMAQALVTAADVLVLIDNDYISQCLVDA